MSLFTLAAGIVAMSLTTMYTGLITPTNVFVRDAILGTEISFSSPEFWSWVSLSYVLDSTQVRSAKSGHADFLILA
jgi:hypothetical protein